ncbi:unnamed protein product [Urochloa humidicola]
MLKPKKMLLQKPNAQPTKVVVSARPKLKERVTVARLEKELEALINLQTRKRGLRKPPLIQMMAERHAEVDLVGLEAPSDLAAGA